jgi:hypothetical protein
LLDNLRVAKFRVAATLSGAIVILLRITNPRSTVNPLRGQAPEFQPASPVESHQLAVFFRIFGIQERHRHYRTYGFDL